MNKAEGNKKGRGITPAPFANNRETGNRPTNQRYDYMPLDFFKGELIDVELEQIRHNKKLPQNYETQDGEIKKEYYEYQNMKFMAYESGRLTIEGSLHKYWNDGLHNHNDFHENDFHNTIEKLESDFGIRPENIRLTCLEFGVNIAPPIETGEILNHCYQHKSVDIAQVKSDARGKYHQAAHSAYILKLYDKARQYGIPQQNMRIEIKVKNWSPYRKQGIVTLADFIEVNKTPFVDSLVHEWGNVLFFDPTARKIGLWSQMADQEYWRQLRKNRSRTTIKRHRKKLEQYNIEHGENIQGQISNLIFEKVDALQKVTNCNFSEKRVCPITGIDISQQRQDSILLSHSGLQYIHEKDPETYFLLSYQFLSDKWQNSPVDVQIREIAHNIRNKYYNKKRPTRKSPYSGQLNLSF